MPRRSGHGQRRIKRQIDGILLLDKPTGITSNRALQIAKRLYQAAKAGHSGSLDPLASGMLPLCFGQATKVSGFMLEADKRYEFELNLGIRTDTGDADGEIAERSSKTRVSEDELAAALDAHRGELQQIPPMHSALKQGGKRLYELARAGIEVEREPRDVTIYELHVIRFDPCRPVLAVRCSKGTYVRRLAETIAEAAGSLGHVTVLRRTGIEPFEGHSMVTLDTVEALGGDLPALDALLLPPDAALQDLPQVQLNADEAYYLRNGHAVGHAPRGTEGTVRVYGPDQAFLGLGNVQPGGEIAPRRLFVNPG